MIAVNGDSFMYEPIARGKGVINCYQPIARQIVVGSERWKNPNFPIAPEGIYSPLIPGENSVNERCRQSVRITQNHFSYDSVECPKDLCFSFNMLKDPSQLSFDSKRGFYCARQE